MIIQPGVLQSASQGVTPEGTDSAIIVPPVAIIPYPAVKPYSSYITAPASTGEPSYTSISYHWGETKTGITAPGSHDLALLAPGLWTITLSYYCELYATLGGIRTPSGATSNGDWGIDMAQLGDVAYKAVVRVSPQANTILWPAWSSPIQFTMNFQRAAHFIAQYGRLLAAPDQLRYIAYICAVKHD